MLDGFPVSRRQADLMEAHSIIPMRVVELQIDTVEVLKRALGDKMKPTRSDGLRDRSLVLYCTLQFWY